MECGEKLVDASLALLGGVASILVGLTYLGVLITAVRMPRELQTPAPQNEHEFWTVLSRNPRAHLAYHWGWAVSGVLALATVPAVFQLVRPVNEGWAFFASALAFLGFAVNARSHLMEVAFDRKIIRVYPESDPAFRQAVHVVAGLALDVPDGFLTHGGVGLWMVVVSLLLSLGNLAPSPLVLLGIGAAILNWLTVAGFVLLASHDTRGRWPLQAGLGLGNIVTAAWFVWLGTILISL